MALADLPNIKWVAAGKQVILKGDFSKIEEAILAIIRQITDVASSATPTPAVGVSGAPIQYNLTALAAAATFGLPTGTSTDGQELTIRILDNGTARALAWTSGAGGYIARGVALPSTTVISKYLYVTFIFNAVANRWDCVRTSQEA